MPPGLSYTHTGISHHEIPISRDSHRSGNFPHSGVMIKTPQGGALTGSKTKTSYRVRHIGETHRHGPVEIRCSIGLNRNHQRQIQPHRQGLRQPVGRNRGNAYTTTARPIVPKEGIRGNFQLRPCQLRKFRQDGVRKRHHGRLGCTHGLQRAGNNIWQINHPAASGGIVRPAGDGHPDFVDKCVVASVGKLPRHRPPVHFDKKLACWHRSQSEAPIRGGGRADGFLSADHLNDHARQWHIRPHRVLLGCQHPPHHARAGYGGDADRVKVKNQVAPGNPIAVKVQQAIEGIPQIHPFEMSPDPGRSGQLLQRENGSLQAVTRYFDTRQYPLSGKPQRKIVRCQGHGRSERQGKTDHRLPGQCHLVLSMGRGAFQGPRMRNVGDGGLVQHQVHQLLHIGLIQQTITCHISKGLDDRMEKLNLLQMVHQARHITHGIAAILVEIPFYRR